MVFAALVLPTCGCSNSGPTPVAVAGNVLLDGSPMADGTIYFQPGDGGVPVPGKVLKGRYSLQALPGEYRVAIQQDRDTGTKNIYGEPQMESMVAARYNVETILKAKVTADGAGEHHFEVHSK